MGQGIKLGCYTARRNTLLLPGIERHLSCYSAQHSASMHEARNQSVNCPQLPRGTECHHLALMPMHVPMDEAAPEPRDSSQDKGQVGWWKVRRWGGWMHPQHPQLILSPPHPRPRLPHKLHRGMAIPPSPGVHLIGNRVWRAQFMTTEAFKLETSVLTIAQPPQPSSA